MCKQPWTSNCTDSTYRIHLYLWNSEQANSRSLIFKPPDTDSKDSKKSDYIDLKVGRAVNLTERLKQWKTQCSSKSQVLRGFYPGSVDPDYNSLMHGRIQAGEKGPMCHRVERLVHLELADLVLNTPYLLPGWPNPPEMSKSSTPPKKPTPKPCEDCQTNFSIFNLASSLIFVVQVDRRTRKYFLSSV